MAELSPTAELFLIAIDPADGRLVKRHRRRFRKALGGRNGQRSAIRELRAGGFIERSAVPGRHPIVLGSGASKPLARVRRNIDDAGFNEPRDAELLVLLTWTGVLASRLNRTERRRALERLKALLAAPRAEYNELGPIDPIASAVGNIAYRQEMDLLQEMIGDLVSGDAVTLDLGGGGGGAGD